MRKINSRPCCCWFRPEDPLKKGLLGVTVKSDEFEALKLHDADGLNQKDASKKMNVSQPTFARILSSVHKKMAKAIVEGREVRIDKRQ